jgi:hypothetical protein
MTALELYTLYRDKSWQWENGAGLMREADRQFSALGPRREVELLGRRTLGHHRYRPPVPQGDVAYAGRVGADQVLFFPPDRRGHDLSET